MARNRRALFSKTRQAKRRRMLYYKLGAALLTLALLFVGSVYLHNHERFRLSEISVLGSTEVRAADIEETVREELKRNYAYVYHTNNALLYPKQQITQVLLETYPRIADLTLTRSGMRQLVVRVTERAPVALWCESTAAKSTHATLSADVEPETENTTKQTKEEHCRYLDKAGVAYAPAPNFSEGAYLRFYGTLSEATPAPTYLDHERFTELLDLNTYLTQSDLSIRAIYTKEGEGITLTLSKGTELRFPLTMPASELVASLFLVRESEALSDTPLEAIEYFDFRFGDKVYYRLHGDSSTDTALEGAQNE